MSHASMRHAGARFVAGFVSEEGKPVVNEIGTGASAIFPVGELSTRYLISVLPAEVVDGSERLARKLCEKRILTLLCRPGDGHEK